MLSLDAEQGRPVPGSRPGRSALAVTALPAASVLVLAACSGSPVINYEYAIVSTAQPSATLAQDLRAFLSWTITSGTAQLGPVNFQPLPASVVTQARAQIAKIAG